MIKNTGAGFKVTSESGNKNLSKPDLTKEQAVKRLKQIEWFKSHKPTGPKVSKETSKPEKGK